MGNVLDGSEVSANDLLSGSHHSLQGLTVHGSAAHMIYGDAVGQDALDRAPVESGEDVRGEVCSPKPSEEVQSLVGFLGQVGCVPGPGQVVGDVHPQELGALDDLHISASYGEGSVGGLVPPEVNNDFLCLVDIQVQVVIGAPAHQMFHLLSLRQLLIVLDETHHCCVIRVLNDVVGGGASATVMGHQGEEERAQHTALRGAGAQSDGVGGVASHPYRLGPVGEKVQNPVAHGGTQS